MRRTFRREQFIILLLCVDANIVSIYGFVLWCSRSDLSYELIMDRAYDIGSFGSLYLWTLLIVCINIFNPELSEKSVVFKTVLRRPIELFYLMGIVFNLIQGSHFIVPAVQELFDNNSIAFVVGFLVDMYFLLSCFAEIFFEKKVLNLWNIGMIVLYVGVFGAYVINSRITGNICCELFAHIIWHIQFLCMVLLSYKEKLLNKTDTKDNLL